jgi:hypothetical protein
VCVCSYWKMRRHAMLLGARIVWPVLLRNPKRPSLSKIRNLVDVDCALTCMHASHSYLFDPGKKKRHFCYIYC